MIHSRQFILSDSEYLVDNTWNTLRLFNNKIFSYSALLNVMHNADYSILIVGHVWQSDSKRKDPQDIIDLWNNDTKLEEIYEQEDTWCGRYIIITPRDIITDATASFSVFYADNVVSSSLYLAHSVFHQPYNMSSGDKVNIDWFKEFQYPDGITEEQMKNPSIVDYFPGPTTFYKDIKRLLPSEVYSYISNKTSFRPLLLNTYNITDSERLDNFAETFVHSLKEMASTYKDSELWLAISGGKDSRTCLAALTWIKTIPFRMFTIYKRDATMTEGYPDYMCSKLLSRITNTRMVVIRYLSKKCKNDLLKNLLIHNSGLAMSKVRYQYCWQLFSQIQKNGGVVVKNQIWELITGAYNNDEHFNTPQGLISIFSEKGKAFEYASQAYTEHIKYDAINSNISFGDRVYWDLRCGSWIADNLQGYDILNNVEIVQVFNCRRFIELLIGMDDEYRHSRQYEIDLTEKWCPAMKGIPYDDTYSDIWMHIKKCYARVIRKMKKIF